jgi:uncharacterized membrane protein
MSYVISVLVYPKCLPILPEKVAGRRSPAAVHAWILGGTAFLASAVEAVEALTIVLAVGATRSWRVALLGTAAATAVLVALAIVFGPLIGTRIPVEAIRIVAGALALYFGFTWLRKAILRAAGRKALRDEAASFEKQRALLAREQIGGFATAFNGVFVEGLEVVVIVVSLGTASAGGMFPAAAGAVGAFVAVALAGLVVHRPLARVPENLMKTIVGIMLLSFGTFWIGEALGVHWPLDDAFIVALIAIYAALTAVAIAALRRNARASTLAP